MTTPRTVLLTGATSGIGSATARLLAQRHFELVLCGRRADRLDSLQGELSKHTQVATLAFDLQDKDAIAAAMRSLRQKTKQVDILINNAGAAYGLSLIQDGDTDDWDAMIDINVRGLLHVSRAVMPGMIKRGSGHIVNVGSIAGKEVYLKGNVYCATKFAVDAITKSMRLDLNDYPVNVTAINPGLVETEFSQVRFKGDKQRAAQSYSNFPPLQPEDVAELILFAITRPAHVNLADALILPAAQASTARARHDPKAKG